MRKSKVKSDLKERKVSKDTAKDKCLKVFHKKSSNTYKNRKTEQMLKQILIYEC